MQQREEKQLEASLESLITQVAHVKNALHSFIFKLENEYERLTWPSVLDNFALLSGQLNTINKLLKNDKTPSFRNQLIIPLLLSQDRDDDLAVRRVRGLNAESDGAARARLQPRDRPRLPAHQTRARGGGAGEAAQRGGGAHRARSGAETDPDLEQVVFQPAGEAEQPERRARRRKRGGASEQVLVQPGRHQRPGGRGGVRQRPVQVPPARAGRSRGRPGRRAQPATGHHRGRRRPAPRGAPAAARTAGEASGHQDEHQVGFHASLRQVRPRPPADQPRRHHDGSALTRFPFRARKRLLFFVRLFD
ncbi:mediator of RNA polymerase II transcription subunit 8 isoform X2 [Phyllopteryx taeniolatus]|uniref:mediator of RNA polymerase II transcription subunit 8 isoform X2 n=1 Tax=Phyllopteryx taeniolatus TaxID=161469 RepID=UPI002AD4509F|nr:mediator of RNA polymerase II transcription subunit 8 isoform X2 [Phyllopteryx taeniolatus]